MFFLLFDWILKFLGTLNFAVTVVDSGTRALQYLGLDGDKSSIGIEEKEICNLHSILLFDDVCYFLVLLVSYVVV